MTSYWRHVNLYEAYQHWSFESTVAMPGELVKKPPSHSVPQNMHFCDSWLQHALFHNTFNALIINIYIKKFSRNLTAAKGCWFSVLVDFQFVKYTIVLYNCFVDARLICQNETLEIIFALDSSSSVMVKNFNKMLHFTKDILQGVTISDKVTRVAAVTFDSRARLSFTLPNHNTREATNKKLDDVRYNKVSG